MSRNLGEVTYSGPTLLMIGKVICPLTPSLSTPRTGVSLQYSLRITLRPEEDMGPVRSDGWKYLRCPITGRGWGVSVRGTWWREDAGSPGHPTAPVHLDCPPKTTTRRKL